MCGRCRHVFNAFETLKRVEDSQHGMSAVPPVDTDYSGTAVPTPTPTTTRKPAEEALSTPVFKAHEAVVPLELMTNRTPADTNLSGKDGKKTASPLLTTPRSPSDVTQLRWPTSPVATEETGASTVVKPPESTSTFAIAKTDDLEVPDWQDNAPLANVGREVYEVHKVHDVHEATIADAIYDTEQPDIEPGERNNPLMSRPIPTPRAPTRMWPWLMVLAGLALALQAVYFWRSEIVQHFPQYPQIRTAMAAACEPIGCSISWGREAQAIKIESSDLIEPPGKPGRILLNMTVANRASTKQDFPSLEVKLMDAANAVISSRILSPPDYLGRIPAAEEGLAANAELYVNLNLEVAGKVPASGYGLRAFYP